MQPCAALKQKFNEPESQAALCHDDIHILHGYSPVFLDSSDRSEPDVLQTQESSLA